MTMGTPVDGVDFLIHVNTGTEASPVYTVLGGQRSATFKRQAEEIDASSKTSGGWKDTIPGLRSWGIDADALVLANDEAYVTLDSCYMNRQPVMVKYVRQDGSYWTGKATITDLSESAPHNDVATYTLTLSGIGAPVRTTPEPSVPVEENTETEEPEETPGGEG